MAIDKLIERDYYPPTKAIGYISRKFRVVLGITSPKATFLLRICISFFIFGFLAFGIPTIVGLFTGDFLLDSIEIVLAFLWLAIAGVLIDFFEYAVDDFWIAYKKLVKLGAKEFENIKKEYHDKIFSKKYILFSILVYLVIFPLLFDALREHSLIVIIMVDLLMIIAAIMWGIVFYLTFYMYYFIKKISSYPLAVNPFDPDGFGGLSIIGKLPLRIAALISSGSLYIPYGMNRVFYMGMETPVGLFILFGVIVVSFVIAITYFVPLFPINRIAKNMKNNMLDTFSSQLKIMIGEPDKKTCEKNYLKTLVAFEHYREIKQMKVWPFSPKMLFELFAYILLPAFLTFIGWYLQIV